MTQAAETIPITPVTFLYDAFLSFSTLDEDLALKIVCGLEVRGLSIWFAPNEIPKGNRILSKVETGIRLSKNYLALCSPNYLNSKWCTQEKDWFFTYHIADNTRKMIPISTFGISEIPPSLQSLLGYDLTQQNL